MKTAAAFILVSLVVGGCSSAPPAATPIPTWPVAAETLPTFTSPGEQLRVTCGTGRTFPLAGLEAPVGAEEAAGLEFDALRAGLSKFGSAFDISSMWTWQLAGRDDKGATFLARTDDLGPPGWVYLDVQVQAGGWQPESIGQCDPHTVLSNEFGPASWALDPAFAAPTEASTELHVLVWERACSGGSPTTGRMSAPVIQSTGTTVVITIGVRPLAGFQTCPGPPGTPATMRLPEPLGDRTLLDGGHVPPVPPSPAF